MVLLSASMAQAAAPEWVLRRFDGRDYVTLDSVAQFYGFPAPPRIEPVPFLGPPAPGLAPDSLGMADPISDFTLKAGANEM
jgi:hypothetical protein